LGEKELVGAAPVNQAFADTGWHLRIIMAGTNSRLLPGFFHRAARPLVGLPDHPKLADSF
jgi:hypothetical protein